MQYTTTYQSPLGKILLAADEIGITGLWFEDQKYFAWKLDSSRSLGVTCHLDRANDNVVACGDLQTLE